MEDLKFILSVSMLTVIIVGACRFVKFLVTLVKTGFVRNK